jgi:acyl-CoA synthetase (NDP forming)
VTRTQPNTAGLDALLAPSSVAIVGASDDPTRIGGRPVSYLLQAGFSGAIWPVNPNREIVQGLRAYRSIADLPEAPDACVVAVAAPLVIEALEACADQGVKSAIIFSSGFAEAGDDGKAAQARITRIARERGVRVVGPNTLGVFNARTRWMGTFASTILYGTPEPGPISIASQSGAVGSELFNLLRRHGLGTGVWITTGNEADVDLADAVAYLADDADTGVVVVYAEGVRNGPAMRAALTRASDARKPVIFLKSGKSDVGAAAVEAHTATDAGCDAVYDALFRQLGVVRVSNAEELVDAAYIATRAPLPVGRNLLILTISGGAGVQMADAAADLGLEVPSPSAAAQEELKTLLPFAGVRNPVDVTAQVFNDMGLIGRYLRILLDDGRFDAVALFLTSVAASASVSRPLVAELQHAMSRFPSVPLVISLAAPTELVQAYADAGYAVFEEPTRTVRALSILVRTSESLGRTGVAPAIDVPRGAVRVAGGAALRGARALELLESWGIPVGTGDADDTGQGADLSVAIERDPTFGPTVTLGLGGELGIVLDDRALRLAPFGEDEGRRMIDEFHGSKLFAGLDRDALARLLSRLSGLAAAEADTLASAELSPVRLLPVGRGVRVLGAVVTSSGH